MDINTNILKNTDIDHRTKSRTWYTSDGNVQLSRLLENFDKYFDKDSDMRDFFLPQYEQCKLYAPKIGTWLFEWYNFHPQKNRLERVRKTLDINRIKTISERTRVAKNIVRHINRMLAAGWNYWVHEKGITSDRTDPYNPTIISALNEALKERQLGKTESTASSYGTFVTKFSEWLTANNYHELPVRSFKTITFKKFIADRKHEGKSNRNINDFINFFKTTFDVLVDNDLIAKNPIKAIKFLPEEESTKFKTIHENELQTIATTLKAYNINYYIATKFLSDLYIRPAHWSDIKISFINFEKETIHLPGYMTKNHKNATKQLFPDMIALLKKIKADTLNKDYYLFGKHFEPSPTKHKRLKKDASDLWKKIVRDMLGIDKYLYALKHTSATYIVNENINIDTAWLTQQMEHHSIAQTETYINEKKEKRIDASKINRVKY